MEVQAQNRPTATKTVHVSSKIGRVLGELHDLIGSERFGALMKKGEAYDWTKNTRHEVPDFLHGPLEKHIGPEQDGDGSGGGGKKRTRSEQQSTDEPKPSDQEEEKPEGGEEKRVAQGEDVQVILSTQGTAAKTLPETLPLDIWKSVIRIGGWDVLMNMMDPFGDRWALEDPVEFFQMILDFAVYEKDDPTLKLSEILRNHSKNQRVATMFMVPLEGKQISAITSDSKSRFPYLYADHVFQEFYNNSNQSSRLSVAYFPNLEYALGDEMEKKLELVLDAGLCLRYGPVIWPIFSVDLDETEKEEEELAYVTKRMLERRGRFITPASVGLSVLAKPFLFDLVLEAAKRNGIPLMGLFKELTDDIGRIQKQGRSSIYTRMTTVFKEARNNLGPVLSLKWKDVILENIAKLPDYGGGDQAVEFFQKFVGQEMATKYIAAGFPELDLSGSISAFLSSQVQETFPDYTGMMTGYQQLTASNKTVDNKITIKHLAHYYIDAFNRVYPIEEMQQFTDALVPHVRDADVLIATRPPGLFYSTLTRDPKFAPVLKQVARATSFTLTGSATFVSTAVDQIMKDPKTFWYIKTIFEARAPKRLVAQPVNIPLREVIETPEFDHRLLLDASRTDLGRVFDATTGISGLVVSYTLLPVMRSYLRRIVNLQPNASYRSIVTPEWIMDRCNIAENDNLMCALFALSYSESYQKRLCEMAAQKMTPEQISLSSVQIVYLKGGVYHTPALNMFLYSEADVDPSTRAEYTKVQEMFVYLVDLMHQRHGTAFDLVPHIMSAPIDANFKIPNIYLDLARVIKARTGDSGLYTWLLRYGHQAHVLEAAIGGSEFKTVGSMINEITSLRSYEVAKKKTAILAMVKKMIESFPNSAVRDALSDGKFLKQIVNWNYHRIEITGDLMALLAPIFPMDFKFANGSTFLHWFAHYMDPVEIIKKYKEATKKTPNLFALNSDGVSVIGVYFWHQKNPYESLRKLATEYQEYADYRKPHVLTGMITMDHRMTPFGDMELPAKHMKDEAKEKVIALLGEKPSDAMLNARRGGSTNEIWWSCKMGRALAKWLSTRYPRLNMAAYVDRDGDNALLSYILNEKTTTATINLEQVEQLLKVGVSVSQLNSNQTGTAVHHFVAILQQTKTTKAILKRLIQHVSFDRTIKPTQGRFKDMTAKEVAALAKKTEFVIIFEKQGFTTPSPAAAAASSSSSSDVVAMEQ